jgi:hypothetical protein
LSGTIPLVERPRVFAEPAPYGDAGSPDNIDEMVDVLHLALVRRGLTVAQGSSFDAFDLRIIVPPYIRVAVLFLTGGGGVSLGWRTSVAGWRIAALLAVLLIILRVGGFSLTTVAALCGLAGGAVAAFALRRALRVPAVLSGAAVELAAKRKTMSQTGRGQRPCLPL